MANQVDYRDPTPNNFPQDYDPAKVDPRVKLRSESIKHKQKGEHTREAMYQALEISSVDSSEARATADESSTKVDYVLKKITENSGDSAAPEVIAARKPSGQESYSTLGDRLDAADADLKSGVQIAKQQSKIGLTTGNSDVMATMSVVANIKQTESDTVEARVFQAAQIDEKTGLVYVNSQTDDAGSQAIDEYDPTSGKLLRRRDLNLVDVVWLQGTSLFKNDAGHVCFIIPINMNGEWVVFDFETGTKSAVIKLDGSSNYCIDNTGAYFVTIQERYDSHTIGFEVMGFNIYDLNSVINLAPKLVKFIPAEDQYIRGGSKIQGLTMIDDAIYLGRGKDELRTTVVTSGGTVSADYNWNKHEIASLLGFDESIQPAYMESEGVSWMDGNPVLSVLVHYGTEFYYCLLQTNATDGTLIDYKSAATLGAISRPVALGATRGIAITTGGADAPNILTLLSKVKQVGTYSFRVLAGNIGLSANMEASIVGTAIARQVIDGGLKSMAVIGIDYNNVTWTIYYSEGVWSKWSNIGQTPAQIHNNQFDPMATESGLYRTISPVNSPKGTEARVKIYQINNSAGYKSITATVVNNNEEYRRTVMADGTDYGWQKLTSTSVAVAAYQLMTTQAALKTAQSQNAKMAYQLMTLGGKQG